MGIFYILILHKRLSSLGEKRLSISKNIIQNITESFRFFEIIKNYPEDNKSFLLNTPSSVQDTFEKFNSLKKQNKGLIKLSAIIGYLFLITQCSIGFTSCKRWF